MNLEGGQKRRRNSNAGKKSKPAKKTIGQPRKKTWQLSRKKPTSDVGVIHWLGVSPSNSNPFNSEFDIIRVGREGIAKSSLENLAPFLGISKKSLAEEILGISIKTLERKRSRDLMDKRVSSHAVEIAKILEHAYLIFDDSEKVSNWINRENKALENQKPLHMLDTLSGINMVNDILGRIEEGVYS